MSNIFTRFFQGQSSTSSESSLNGKSDGGVFGQKKQKPYTTPPFSTRSCRQVFSFFPKNAGVSYYTAKFQEKMSTQAFRTVDYFKYATQISCLSNAICKLSDQFSNTQIYLKNVDSRNLIKQSPILTAINNPNPWDNYSSLAVKMMQYFQISGNCYWIMRQSSPNTPPNQLFCVSPLYVNPQYSGGVLGSFRYQEAIGFTGANPIGSIEFSGVPFGNDIRYLNEDGTMELFFLSNSNPYNGSGISAQSHIQLGESKLRPLGYQLECFLAALVHNISLLQNSGTPSGMVVPADPEIELTQEQLDNMHADYYGNLAGPTNAGKVMFGQAIKFVPFSVTNRDMNYVEARQQLKEEIYNQFNIPLALINSDSLSLANMTVAERHLFNLAILPDAQKIYDKLTKCYLSRFPNGENMLFTYDKFQNPSLREKAIEELTQMYGLGVISDNELRIAIDRSTIDDPAADDIYKPSNVVPAPYTAPTPE